MKKKVLAFVMAAAMVFSLAACGGSSNAGSDSSNSDSSASDSSDSSSTATGAAFKLGGTGSSDRRRRYLRQRCQERRSDRCGRDQRRGRRYPVRAEV